MSKYTRATPEGEVPMTPEQEAFWDAFLAEQAAKEAARLANNSDTPPTIPTTTP